MEHADGIIPPQQTGRGTDFRAERQLNSRTEAHGAFQAAAAKLLTVNQWHNYAGAGSAKFVLTDNQGGPASGTALEGFMISIDLPGPGPDAGDGLDWVIIERLESIDDASEEEEFVSMVVRPVPGPNERDGRIAHFYKEVSTSTFIARRVGNTVSAEVHGRNETPNNADVDLYDKIRNTAVALSARIGLASPQWQKLADGLIAE